MNKREGGFGAADSYWLALDFIEIADVFNERGLKPSAERNYRMALKQLKEAVERLDPVENQARVIILRAIKSVAVKLGTKTLSSIPVEPSKHLNEADAALERSGDFMEWLADLTYSNPEASSASLKELEQILDSKELTIGAVKRWVELLRGQEYRINRYLMNAVADLESAQHRLKAVRSEIALLSKHLKE